MGQWYHHLRIGLIHAGAAGLLVMGVLDASLIPTPGGQDLLVVVLAAAHPDWWLYYGLVATVGSVLGASLTYRLGRGRGRRALDPRLSRGMYTRVRRMFERWGFGALFLAAILPPPTPMGPFLLVAGAAHYPWPRFVLALTLAKAIRYLLAAYLAALYGRRTLVALLARDYRVILVSALGLGAAVWIATFLWRRRARTVAEAAPPRSPRRRTGS